MEGSDLKGLQALSLTRSDSDASVAAITPLVIRTAVTNATDIHKVDVMSFYERIM